MIRKKYNKKKLDFQTDDLESLSISDLKKLADYWLRQYLLRQPNALYCPIKKRNYSVDKMQVAHFVDRNVNCLRYSLDNCHMISEQSNMWDAQIPKEGYKSLHHFDYEQFLLSEYGEDFVKDLKERAKNICILNKNDYICIIEKFKNNA